MGVLWPASQLAILAHSSFFYPFFFSTIYVDIASHNRTVGILFLHNIPHDMQYAPHITDLSTVLDASFLYMMSLN